MVFSAKARQRACIFWERRSVLAEGDPLCGGTYAFTPRAAGICGKRNPPNGRFCAVFTGKPGRPTSIRNAWPILKQITGFGQPFFRKIEDTSPHVHRRNPASQPWKPARARSQMFLFANPGCPSWSNLSRQTGLPVSIGSLARGDLVHGDDAPGTPVDIGQAN